MRSMWLRANAKVNLWLSVTATRPDGLHDIDTVFQSVGLHDTVVVEAAREGTFAASMSLEGVAGPTPPADEDLVVRAARLIAARIGREPGARVRVIKRIPMGAGLAGGSADAAATLAALDELFDTRLGDDVLAEMGAALGSDVPFCLLGGTARGRGRGEILEEAQRGAPLWLILAMSAEPLATSAVYLRWDDMELAPGPPADAMLRALETGGPEDVASLLHNDLETAALSLRPELAAGKRALLDAGALGALVTGSGPTLFAVARDEAHARAIGAEVAGSFDRVEVTEARSRSIERE